MSNTNSTANVKLTVNTDGTIKKATQEAAALRKEFEGAQKAAAGAARVPRPVSAARAAAKMDPGAELGRESGIARSIGAGTGAAGRDFAKQSEGLGGLVRVYATFAANIFAATAAFGALSRAADTTNLVKGLDQLGAASGKSLGSLAKQLVTATDGALSLRDAMTSVAQASSGGMSNAQITKMAEVAKRAAQALGRDMPDAINRLTRGITKLEPELLDEIGIMVRLDDTTQEYAKSVGKSVNALTMFEKRQAFANAVLEQGAKKFGEIELNANPYSKILASTQDLLQSGLELLNKVLGPIVSMLASSPTGLSIALGGIAAMLLKQAIPALGAYRKNMQAAADESLVKLSSIVRDRQSIIEEADRKAADAAVESFKKQADVQKNIIALRQSASNFTNTRGKNWQEIAGKSPFEMTDKDIQALDRRSKFLLKSTDNMLKAEGTMMAAHLSDIRNLRNQENIIHENTVSAIENRDKRFWTFLSQEQKIYDKAMQQASNRRILAITAETAATLGPIAAWRKLNEEIAKSKRGKAVIQVAVIGPDGKQVEKDGIKLFEEKNVKATNGFLGSITNGFTRLKGAISIATSAASTFLNAFGVWFQIIGLVTAGLALLNSWASKNTKESEATAAAMDTLKTAADTVDKTLDNISRKKPLESINTESINARANALDNLAISISGVMNSLEKELAAANSWDKLKDWFAGLFNSDSTSKAVKETAIAISKAFDIALPGKNKDEAALAIKQLLGVEPEDISGMIAALSKNFDVLGPKAQAAIGKMSKELSIAASFASQLDDAFKKGSESFDAIINAAMPKDNIATLGMDMLNIGKEMAGAFEEPTTVLSQLNALISNTSRLKLLNPETSAELMKMAPAIKAGSEELLSLQNELKDAENILKDLKTRKEELSNYDAGPAASSMGEDTQAPVSEEVQAAKEALRQVSVAYDAASKHLDNVRKQVEVSQSTVSKYLTDLKKVQAEVFINGAKILKDSISIGFEQAALKIQKGWASILPQDTAGGIELRARLEIKSIELQERQQGISLRLIDNLIKLTLETEKANILKERDYLNSSEFKGTDKQERLNRLETRLQGVNLAQSKDNPFQGKGALNKAIKAGSVKEETAEYFAAQTLLPLLLNKEAEAAKARGLAADKVVVILTQEAALLDNNARKLKESAELAEAGIRAQQSILNLRTEGLAYLTDEELNYKERLESAARESAFLRETLAVKTDISKLDMAIVKDPANADKHSKSKLELQERLNNLIYNQSIKEIEADNQATKFKLDNAKKVFDSKASMERTIAEIQTSSDNNKINLLEEQLQTLEAVGAVSKKYVVDQTRNINILKEEVRYSEAVRKAREDIAKAKNEKSQAQQRNPELNSNDPRLAVFDAQVSASEALIENETALTNAKKESINAQADYNKLIAEQEEFMEHMIDLTSVMSGAFGEVGNSIGKVVEALVLSVQSSERFGKSIEANGKAQAAAAREAREAAAGGLDTTDIDAKANKLAKEGIKLEKDKKKAEMDSAIAAISAAKGVFKEKTAAYKALHAVEKAMHVYKLAMWIKESGAEAAKNAMSIAGTVARAGVDAVAAVIKAISSLPPPLNFIAGAATAAVVGALLSKIGGSKPQVSGGGFSAKEQQDVQGTGQAYIGGELVNRGGSALGDNTAKASSLQNSIERLEEHSFSTMEYSNKMLENLKAINKNTEVLGAIILQEGFNSKGTNIDGSTEFGTTMAKNPIPTLGALIFGSDSGFGKLSDKISNAVFGGKTTVELQDIGIAINGIIKDITEDGTSLITTYQNIKTSRDGGLFGRDKTNYDTKFEEVKNPILKETIQTMFSDIADTVEEAAVVLGKDRGLTNTLIDNFNVLFKTSFKDLKPEELVDALNSEFSVQFNLLAEKVLSEFQKFRKPAEEFGDTIVRLARNIQVASFALESAGLAVKNITDPLLKIEINESLIDSLGGLDNFVEKTNFFKENFLTAAEQLAPVQSRVTAEMERLGFASVTTREAFADLVRAQDLSTETGQNTFAALMSVAEGFAEVYEWADKANEELRKMSQKEFEAAAIPLTSKILELTPGTNSQGFTGYKSMAVEQTRSQSRTVSMDEEEALRKAAIDESGKIIDQEKINIANRLASLRSLQEEVWALEDAMAVRVLGISLLKAEGKGYEALVAERTLNLQKLTNEEQRIQLQIYAAEDLAKTRNLEMTLMEAQGRSYDVLLQKRELELMNLSETDRAIQIQINAAQDLVKTRGLEQTLLEAQGKSYDALILKREQELVGLSDIDKAVQLLINQAQDLAKTRGLEQTLLEAQGNSYDALILKREQELIGLSDTDKAIQILINQAQDLAKTFDLENKLLSTMGFSYTVLVRTREKELLTLSAADQIIQRNIYEQEDLNNTTNLYVELLEAGNRTVEATIVKRKLELKGLSATDQQLKIRIWRLQDEAKILSASNNQQIRILELLGKSSEALALTRKIELETMDEQLIPAQLYIYALEDEAAIKEKLKAAHEEQKNAIENNISSLKNSIKTLKEYNQSLLTGGLSPLTPEQRYNVAKQEFATTAALASGPAVTDEQKQVRQDAIDKLPTLGNTLLEASRTLFASSEYYTNDFNWVRELIDKTISKLEPEISEAERQLAVLKASEAALDSIKDNTAPLEQLLKDLADAQIKTALALETYKNAPEPSAALTAAIVTGAAGESQFGENATITTLDGITSKLSEFKSQVASEWGTQDIDVIKTLYERLQQQGVTSAMLEQMFSLSSGSVNEALKTYGLSAIDSTGYSSSTNMDSTGFTTNDPVLRNGTTNVVASESSINTANLVQEIKQLKEELKALRDEQKEQTGSLIKANYDANIVAADVVANQIRLASNNANWDERVKPKIA